MVLHEALLKSCFWSGSILEVIGEAQNSFHYDGGAIFYGSNRLLFFNPFMKTRMKLFYQTFSKMTSSSLEKQLYKRSRSCFYKSSTPLGGLWLLQQLLLEPCLTEEGGEAVPPKHMIAVLSALLTRRWSRWS